jgi:hypothetical protein
MIGGAMLDRGMVHMGGGGGHGLLLGSVGGVVCHAIELGRKPRGWELQV